METRIICPAILCSTFILVFSLVAIVYATMMIYIPANLEMKANVTGPLKCTTIKMDFNVSQGNCHWSSCIEWCLNKPPKLCHQVKVDVRRPGVDLKLHDCEIEMVGTCKNADDLEDISYRATDCDVSCYERLKEKKLTSNGNILMCNYARCRNYSEEYNCTNVKTYLHDLENPSLISENYAENSSICDCTEFKGNYYNKVDYYYMNKGQCPKLNHQLYLSCEQLCEYNQQCFNMSRTVRRGYIGHSHIIRDKVYKVYGSNKPKISDFTRHYQCQNEFCAEIRDMQCDRNCHGVQFKTGDGRTVIYSKETIIILKKCSEKHFQNSIMTCNGEYTLNRENKSFYADDCISGKQTEVEVQDHDYMSLRNVLNTSQMILPEIPQYENLTLYPDVKLLVNLDGCVNSGNCTEFFNRVRKDGRDQSARYVVPCFYDSLTQSAIINHEPQENLRLMQRVKW